MMNLQYVIIGKGKLASYLQENLLQRAKSEGLAVNAVVNWDSISKTNELPKVLIHAGSGRQLSDALDYCRKTGSSMIQASAVMNYDSQLYRPLNFILIESPNLSIPIIKLLHVLKKNGHLFKDYAIEIKESHQYTKTTLPATAKVIADSLGVAIAKIESIRDPIYQKTELQIPENYLDRHAKHFITIREGNCTINIESEVFGYDSYLNGILAITKAMENMEKGKYFITDLVERGTI
jgi:4-hydroxy-tetrahydrodipicolinate reductase